MTDKNGKQSVQCIDDELGMNAKDINDVKNRLNRQGVDARTVEMYGGADNQDKPTSHRRGNGTNAPPGTGSGSGQVSGSRTGSGSGIGVGGRSKVQAWGDESTPTGGDRDLPPSNGEGDFIILSSS